MEAMIAVMSAGGPADTVVCGTPSSSESTVKSGSRRLDPKKIVFVRSAKNRTICPRWNASQALELPIPQRHWNSRGRIVVDVAGTVTGWFVVDGLGPVVSSRAP